MKPYYITTPIYYVNGNPHIGHAYTTILADTFARFNRLLGNEVLFLTGTDEHGEKIEKSAQALGKETCSYVDGIVEQFKKMWQTLHISYDDFIRTTEDRHKKVVHESITRLLKKGDIYKGSYCGWYCIPCESFFLKGQLAQGKCPDCHREVSLIEEANYFFKLSAYQNWLITFLTEHPGFVPSGKREEILSFLKDPLEDLCISRPKGRLSWGIPFPGDEEFVVYVWFDALINYISAIGFSTDEKKFNTWWPANVHLMAKDILRQHVVYWPIMLKALDIPMPEHVMAHGWWMIEGGKVSKSRGNSVDPGDICARYGVDTLRYYFLREAPVGTDGTYSEDLLVERFNTDLANDLGNLVHRSFSMCEKYYQGVIPEVNAAGITHPIKTEAASLRKKLERFMNEELQPRSAILVIWELVTAANKYVEETKPWTLAKDPQRKEELAVFMYALLETLRIIGVALVSFLPETGKKILDLLKIESVDASGFEWGLLKSGGILHKGAPLFPRIES